MRDIHLAEILTARRRQKGITQDELATYVGVSKASVSKWETGTSLPDITLLPMLATYFDISIDDLMGYSPQLSRDAISSIYANLSEKFSKLPFKEVVTECEALVKKYYSCYTFLLEMVQLYVNHTPLADNAERRNELIGSAIKLCEHIRTNSNDIVLAEMAASFQGFCYLKIDDPQSVLELLGETVKPNMNSTMIISQAFQLLGKSEKAMEVIQIDLYLNLMEVFEGLISYIRINLANYETAFTAYDRAEKLSELFQMRRLNPNNTAILYALGAHMFQRAGKKDEAIVALGKYVDVCVHGFFPFKARGDDFFEKVEAWLSENAGSMPRSEITVKESMLNDVLLNPAFDSLHDNPEFTKLIRQLRNFIGG